MSVDVQGSRFPARTASRARRAVRMNCNFLPKLGAASSRLILLPVVLDGWQPRQVIVRTVECVILIPSAPRQLLPNLFRTSRNAVGDIAGEIYPGLYGVF